MNNNLLDIEQTYLLLAIEYELKKNNVEFSSIPQIITTALTKYLLELKQRGVKDE